MVIGCLEGDCHYVNGNIRGKARVERVIKILDSISFGGERLRMYNLSAGEGAKFAAYANEFSDHIATLGPSPVNLARSGAAQNKKVEEEA